MKNEALEGMDRKVLVPVTMDEVRVPVAFRQNQIAYFISWPDSVDTDQYQKFIQAVNLHVQGDVKVTEYAGLGTMVPRGRKRFRRKRDLVVPLLVIAVVVFSQYLAFGPRLQDRNRLPPPR
ncbi:MAG: hypothetical protein ACI9P7_000095 [Candidatus Azotimanducaceae bacterium]